MISPTEEIGMKFVRQTLVDDGMVLRTTYVNVDANILIAVDRDTYTALPEATRTRFIEERRWTWPEHLASPDVPAGVVALELEDFAGDPRYTIAATNIYGGGEPEADLRKILARVLPRMFGSAGAE